MPFTNFTITEPYFWRASLRSSELRFSVGFTLSLSMTTSNGIVVVLSRSLSKAISKNSL